MQRVCFAGLLVFAGCDPNLDFTSQTSSITATGKSSVFTSVTICAGPSGLLSCNDNVGFDVTLGADEQLATEGFLGFGLLEADFATNEADAPVAVVSVDATELANASLPPPFELTWPDATTVVAWGSHVHLVWDAAGTDPMAWTADVSCDGTDHPGQPISVDDTGVLSISTDDFPNGASGSCAATITMTRTRAGTTAGFAAGSTMTAAQARSISFSMQ